MKRLNASKAREQLSAIVNRAACRGQRIVVCRRGKDLAAVIPIKDLWLLERRAKEDTDRADVDDARAALAEPGENIPWEKVKTDLGL
ncbi:MAG: type II toxin-antitoxin system prevent-host-death family antitoxin [Acidobacteriota bacterium]